MIRFVVGPRGETSQCRIWRGGCRVGACGWAERRERSTGDCKERVRQGGAGACPVPRRSAGPGRTARWSGVTSITLGRARRAGRAVAGFEQGRADGSARPGRPLVVADEAQPTGREVAGGAAAAARAVLGDSEALGRVFGRDQNGLCSVCRGRMRGGDFARRGGRARAAVDPGAGADGHSAQMTDRQATDGTEGTGRRRERRASAAAAGTAAGVRRFTCAGFSPRAHARQCTVEVLKKPVSGRAPGRAPRRVLPPGPRASAAPAATEPHAEAGWRPWRAARAPTRRSTTGGGRRRHRPAPPRRKEEEKPRAGLVDADPDAEPARQRAAEDSPQRAVEEADAPSRPTRSTRSRLRRGSGSSRRRGRGQRKADAWSEAAWIRQVAPPLTPARARPRDRDRRSNRLRPPPRPGAASAAVSPSPPIQPAPSAAMIRPAGQQRLPQPPGRADEAPRRPFRRGSTYVVRSRERTIPRRSAARRATRLERERRPASTSATSTPAEGPIARSRSPSHHGPGACLTHVRAQRRHRQDADAHRRDDDDQSGGSTTARPSSW